MMSTRSALLRCVMIAIFLMSDLVFGNILQKRPYDFPAVATVEPEIYTLDGNQGVDSFGLAMPTTSAQTCEQGSVTKEQASSQVVIPGPAATVASTQVTSAPQPGLADCGPCFLYFQVSQ